MIGQLQKHGGDLRLASHLSGIPQEQLLDFSASINPLGFPDWLRPLISSRIRCRVQYPDPQGEELIAALAKFHQINPAEIIIGNGASELLYLLPQVLDCRRLLIPIPSYGAYASLARGAGLDIDQLPLREGNDFQLDIDQLASRIMTGHLIVIGHPNNPTGKLCDVDALWDLVKNHPQNYSHIRYYLT